MLRIFVTMALVVLATSLFASGVQLRYGNICSIGPCLSPLRLGLGAGAAFAAWAAWHHLPSSGALNVTPRARGALMRLGALVIGATVAFAGTLIGILEGRAAMGNFQANPWYVTGGVVLGFLAGRSLWRRASAIDGE